MLLSELKENIYKAEIVDKLEIKTYLPMFTKQLKIEKICGLNGNENTGVIYYENGLALVDNLNKKIACMLVVLTDYCNVEIDDGILVEEIVEILDLLIESGLYKKILDKIGNDVIEFMWELEDEIDNIRFKNNSIEAILSKALDKVIEVIDRNSNPKELKALAKSVVKEFQKLDLNKLEEVNKIKNLNKK